VNHNEKRFSLLPLFWSEAFMTTMVMMRPSVRRSALLFLVVLLLLILATECNGFDISFDQLRGKRILVVGGSGRKFLIMVRKDLARSMYLRNL